MKKSLFIQKNNFSHNKNWSSLLKNIEIERKQAILKNNSDLYDYGANNPVKYTDPDGRENKIEDLNNDITKLPSKEEIYITKFVELLRNAVGAKYSHSRPPSKDKMDCSGSIIYALKEMGYDVPDNLTADQMGSGKVDFIDIYENVDNSKQGEKGRLNFYKFGTNSYVHVNTGVGMKGNEKQEQIVDATASGVTWTNIRNAQTGKQIIPAKENTINQTWAPFSTVSKPDAQGYINWSKLKRK